jgi:hypothetical protein
MIPRRAIPETARAAGVRRDVSANGRSILCGIGRVELPRCCGCRLHLAKQNARARHGLAVLNIEAPEILHRYAPSALRRSPSSEPGHRPHDGDRNAFLRCPSQGRRQFLLAARRKHLIRVAGVAGGVRNVHDFEFISGVQWTKLKIVKREGDIPKAKTSAKPTRQPGSMKGKIRILPGFYKADNEIEALFYEEPIEPLARRPRRK